MKRQLLEFQADRIEAVLARHRVSVRVTGGTVAPRWIQFRLVPAMGTRVSQVTGLAKELALALRAETCRVGQVKDGLTVEIPNPDPRPVGLINLQRKIVANSERGIPFGTALLGLDEEGAPLMVRLPSPQVAHLLVAGTTGSGKTELLRSIIVSLAMSHRPSEISLVLIDPKRRALKPFDVLPHLLRPVVYEASAAKELLEQLVALMIERDHGGKHLVSGDRSGEPRVVVVIDELVDLLLVDPEIETPLMRLAQRGREAGIHLVAATQKPTAAVIGTLTKANFPVRLVGRVTSPEDAKVASGYAGTGAESLGGKGDFIAVTGGQVTRFQAAYVPQVELHKWLEQVGHGIPDKSGIILPESKRTAGQVATDKIAEYVEQVRDAWPSFLNPDGTLRWGAKADLAELIFKVRSTAGHYGRTVNEVIRRLRASEGKKKATEKLLLPPGNS